MEVVDECTSWSSQVWLYGPRSNQFEGEGGGKKKSRLGRDAKIISFKKKKKRYIKYLSKKNLKIIPLQMIPNDQIDYGNNSPLLRDCKASATSFWFNPQRFPVSFSHFLWQAMSQSIFKCFSNLIRLIFHDWCLMMHLVTYGEKKKKFFS